MREAARDYIKGGGPMWQPFLTLVFRIMYATSNGYISR